MNAWKTSPWSIRILILAMVAYIVIMPVVVMKGYLGDGVRSGFMLFMGLGSKVCR